MSSFFYKDNPETNLSANLSDISRLLQENCKASVTYKKGQTIFHEGTRPMGVFFIKSGRVKILKNNQGKELIAGVSNFGSFLGYKELLNSELYQCSAVAIENTEVFFIQKDKFVDILSRESDLFNRLFKVLHQDLIAI